MRRNLFYDTDVMNEMSLDIDLHRISNRASNLAIVIESLMI